MKIDPRKLFAGMMLVGLAACGSTTDEVRSSTAAKPSETSRSSSEGSSTPAAAASSKPDVFAASGRIQLFGRSTRSLGRDRAGAECVGALNGVKDFRDIARGARVAIFDKHGKILGESRLKAGLLFVARPMRVRRCEFNFEVQNVRSGLDSYVVIVGRHATLGPDENMLASGTFPFLFDQMTCMTSPSLPGVCIYQPFGGR
jgi:hypothetical protein